MADHEPLTTAILYQNADKTVTLLDIPKSVSLAQGTQKNPSSTQIYASQPLMEPYPTTEPKSEKAKANVLRTRSTCDPDVNFPDTLLYRALEEIAEHWEGQWCLNRKVSLFATGRQSKKRKVAEAGLPALPSLAQNSSQDNVQEPHVSTQKIEPVLRIPKALKKSRELRQPLTLSTDSSPGVHTNSNMRQMMNRLVFNPHAKPVHLHHAETRYVIPSKASFYLSTISEATATAFSMAAVTAYSSPSATAGRGQFDFILLDPPWENRSVRRSGKYDTGRGSHPVEVFSSTLGQHIGPKGFVACWVTNKFSVRVAALEAFAAWGVQLVEEWAWLKTTVHGVPVTEIEGLWRKPYEILLLGKRKEGMESLPGNVQRRVIVATPDLHSRKPNLKALIEPIMPVNYRALEVFARNLTSGWWAWGDEVLKYNWEGHWSKD